MYSNTCIINILTKSNDTSYFSTRRFFLAFLRILLISKYLVIEGSKIKTINNNVKVESLRECIRFWSALVLFLMVIGKDIMKEHVNFSDEGDDEAIEYMLSIIVPLGLQLMMSEELGTGKLENIITKCLENDKEETLNAILLTFLYVDLVLPRYPEKVKDLLARVKGHKYSLELIYQKLRIFLMMKKIPPEEVQKLAEMIAGTYIKIRSTGENPEFVLFRLFSG